VDDKYDNRRELKMWKVYNGNTLDVNDDCTEVAEFEDIIDAEEFIREYCGGNIWSIEGCN